MRQQLMEFTIDMTCGVYLIHDGAAQFELEYMAYGIKGIEISAYAPNMNAIAERFVGSIRREAMDYYFFFSEKQILLVLQEYLDYFNTKRPHQGIDQQIPMGCKQQL